MTEKTESVLAAVCAADETIKKPDYIAAMSLLRGEKNAVAANCDKPLTRAEVARMLRVSLVTVTTLGKDGTIRRIVLPGRSRALGYSLRSVEEILNGKATDGKAGKIGGAAGV